MKTWEFFWDDEHGVWAMFVSDGTCFIGDTKGECLAQSFEQN